MKKIASVLIIILAFTSITKAQTEIVSYGTSPNCTAYSINYPAAFSYSAGITVVFKAHATCGAGPVTMDINNEGARTIKKNVNIDLAAGDFIANQYVTIIYDGVDWQMIVPAGSPTTAPDNVWKLGGNTNTAISTIGTVNSVDLPIITNNVEAMRVNQSGNIGIATTTPATKLVVNGGVSVSPTAPVLITTDGQQITLPSNGGTSYIKINSNNIVATNRTFTISDGIEPGQMLIIQSISTGGTVGKSEILSTGNCALSSTKTFNSANDTIVLIWDGTIWVELSRSDND